MPGGGVTWVSISDDGFIYISKPTNRTYWVLGKIKQDDRPKLTFLDKAFILKIKTHQIYFYRPADYEKAKKCSKITLIDIYSKKICQYKGNCAHKNKQGYQWRIRKQKIQNFGKQYQCKKN